MSTAQMSIVEVGPRDGFQSIEPYIPVAQKIAVRAGAKVHHGSGVVVSSAGGVKMLRH